MQRGFIITEPDGRRVPVEGTLVVGRTADCGLVIEDNAASRRHLQITAAPDGFFWKDLGSTNGTLLNGSKMLEGKLKSGDKLKIGETELLFELIEAPEAAVEKDDTTRLFHETILGTSAKAGAPPEHNRTVALLEAAYSVANEIATNYNPCDLLDRVLMVTVRAIGAQRGVVLLSGPDAALSACPVCGQVHRILDGELESTSLGKVRISETVARRVMEGGESVLYQDTDNDPELAGAASVMALQLRSILCVPLRAKYGILGILYIDSSQGERSYKQEDLLLAAAVGNSAGIAIENARMHQEILEKQRMDHDIATAWVIQEGFLIREWPEDDPRFRVYGETRPARVVGGDFYDMVQPDADTLGLLIGDVSGKGVPAALTMAQLLAEFRIYARDAHTAAELVARLNESMVRRTRRGIFCTLCYIKLDLNTGEVLVANAGHHPVLSTKSATFHAPASGPPLGILSGVVWEEERIQLQPGDTLLLYTDGIVEASSTAPDSGETRQQFGEQGLAATVQRTLWQSPRELVEAVNAAVRGFCAPAAPHDDCTMAAVTLCESTD